MAPPVRLVLVDHQTLFTRGLALLISSVSDSRVTVVASTSDGSLAPELVRQHGANLAVVDLGLREPGGLGTIAAIKRSNPSVPVLAMSGVSIGAHGGTDCQLAVAALRAGAHGYVPKTAEPETFVTPLLALVEGWTVLPHDVLSDLLTASARSTSAVRTDLTPTDRKLWMLIASGATTQRIARELHVSDRTAKRLTASLLRRLGVSSRAEAAMLAGRVGLLDAS